MENQRTATEEVTLTKVDSEARLVFVKGRESGSRDPAFLRRKKAKNKVSIRSSNTMFRNQLNQKSKLIVENPGIDLYSNSFDYRLIQDLRWQKGILQTHRR